jgi:hypothetical protein
VKALRAAAFLGVCGWSAAACAPASSPDASPIAALHTRECGRCHTPPAPKTHTRAELEDAFGRHRKRAHLTPEEWQAMVEYLAAPAD